MTAPAPRPLIEDLLVRMPANNRVVLEVCAGPSAVAAAYLAANPTSRCIVVQRSPPLGSLKSGAQRIHGDLDDADTMIALDQALDGEALDTIILRDFHRLSNPLRSLSDLRSRAAEGAVCLVAAPNGSHWGVMRELLQDGISASVMDPQAWLPRPQYTRGAISALLRKAGWRVLEAAPRAAEDAAPPDFDEALEQLARTLAVDPATARTGARQEAWIVRAINGPQPVGLTVAAIGMRKNAGVTEARVDYPLAALSTLPGTQVIWGERSVSIPPDWSPGVLILHRQFLNDGSFVAAVNRMIGKGWIVVSDMDDDPDYWPEFRASDYHAYRGVHAVTVSTLPLARLIRQWNPNVGVFPNAIRVLPQTSGRPPEEGNRLRIFFGALNRDNDWPTLIEAIEQAAERLVGRAEFVVVHDGRFHAALPAGLDKEFHATLKHDAYMALLATCDIAMLPLADTPFNHLKSDLKFIECCAAGVVPVCSPVVYDQEAEHLEIGVFARTAEEWRDALLGLCFDREDLRRRRALGLNYVSRRRMHAQQAPARWRYYRSLIENREALEAERRDRVQQHPLPAA